jgi:integrase
MFADELPAGYLLKRCEHGQVYLEAKWRDSRGAQRKRRLGRAWLEESEGGYRQRSGRVRRGYLDERRAHIEMSRTIAEHEEELKHELLEPEATFDDAVERWLDYLENEKRAKPATMQGYRRMLCRPMPSKRRGKPRKARLMRTFGGRRLAEIETEDVARFLGDLDRDGLSARAVNKHRQVLHSIFQYAKRRDTFGLRENPAAETTRRPEGGMKPIDVFEPWEVMRVAEVARAGLHRGKGGYRHSNYSEETWREWRRINEQDAALFVVAAYTGMRMGELRALRWKDIDFLGGRITISRAFSWDTESSTKSRQMRTVPLARQANEVLLGLRERGVFTAREDFVFCRPDGGNVDRTAARKRFVAALQAAGLRVRRFHDLRHTFGSLAIRKFDLVAVQAMMGHSKITTTQRYLHSKPRADDVAKLSAIFDEGVGAQERSAEWDAETR